MHLRFVDRGLPANTAGDGLTRSVVESTGRLRDGLPVLLDDRWRVVEPWLTYFRVVGGTVGRATLRGYGYDALRFASFLEGRGTDVVRARQDDIVAYRQWRLADAEAPVSPSTWAREAVVIRGVYDLLKQTGVLERDPWITVGRSSVFGPGWRVEPDIRPLTREQWSTFRDVGLSGRLPDGSLDESWRGRSPLRSVAGAQVAVTTGMRVSEFSTLLDAEVPFVEGVGVSVLLQACAKYQKRRRVHVPPVTLRAVDLYRQTERRAVVRASSEALWRRRDELLLVDEVDASSGVVRGVLDGVRRRWAIHLLPPGLRRIAVAEGPSGLESASLFVGRGGLPVSLRGWHAVFQAASRRVSAVAAGSMSGRRTRVTPHDLRHTFAVVLLRALTDVALAREAERRAGHVGPATLSEHISINPRLTVQRLLGHTDPATTMVYLRYVEDTDAVVQDVFDSWSDGDVDFAEYALRERAS